jgi:hypothetical protein
MAKVRVVDRVKKGMGRVAAELRCWAATLSRLLSDCLPVAPRRFGGDRSNADTLLKPVVFVAILVLVGPDLFALVELTTLLDLLGATLFVIAFAVGFQLAGVAALKSLRRLLVPPEYLMLIEMRGRPVAVGFGLLYVAGYNLILAGLGLLCVIGASILMHWAA